MPRKVIDRQRRHRKSAKGKPEGVPQALWDAEIAAIDDYVEDWGKAVQEYLKAHGLWKKVPNSGCGEKPVKHPRSS